MEIQVKNNILLIKPESLYEEKILNSEYFQSKLAYRITDNFEKEKSFKVTFNGDIFFIDEKNNIANIGEYYPVKPMKGVELKTSKTWKLYISREGMQYINRYKIGGYFQEHTPKLATLVLLAPLSWGLYPRDPLKDK